MDPRKLLKWVGAEALVDVQGHGAATDNRSKAPALLPRSGKNPACPQTSSAREPGDLGDASSPVVGERQPRSGDTPQPVAQSTEESDACIVPRKSPNTWVTPAEEMEGSRAAEGKPAERNALRAQAR